MILGGRGVDGIDRPAGAWTGRDDGPGPGHARWHGVVRPVVGLEGLAGVATLIGFVSDEGVRRNGGRVGAALGPGALRAALANLADPGVPITDAGDVVVDDGDLEGGQARLGRAVASVLDAGGLPVVLGGGHEVAFGTHLGWAGRAGGTGERWGILNLDAHFDLRSGRASSGTPFAQIADAARAARRPFTYAVAGISRAGNTRVLFDRAADLGVGFVTDEDCTADAAGALLEGVLGACDRLHLSVDLDVLPAAVAPGVSAPAGFGVELSVVRAVVRRAAASGRLGVLEVAELNPAFDVDGRTARTASRLVDEALRVWCGAGSVESGSAGLRGEPGGKGAVA